MRRPLRGRILQRSRREQATAGGLRSPLPDVGTFVMNAYVSKEELALLPSDRISHPEHFADAQSLRNSHGGVFARLAGWIASYVRRQSVTSELENLTDRELADIGLTRPQIGLVFDPRFTARPR